MDHYSSKLAFEFESARVKIYGMEAEVYDSEKGIAEKITSQGIGLEKQNLLSNYLWGSNATYCNFINSLEELIIIEKMLLKLPEEYLSTLSISVDNYLSFNFKNWIIRIVTANDCFLSLVNVVFDLGVSKKLIGDATVAQNRHVSENAELTKKFKEIRKFFDKKFTETGNKGLKNIRNEFVHRGEIFHSKISDLGSQLFMEEYQVKKLSHDDLINLKIEKHKTSINIGKEVKAINQEFIDLMISACDLLTIEFKSRFEKLSANVTKS